MYNEQNVISNSGDVCVLSWQGVYGRFRTMKLPGQFTRRFWAENRGNPDF
jgi:hypothetical protein